MKKKGRLLIYLALVLYLLPLSLPAHDVGHRKMYLITDPEGIANETQVWGICSLKDAPRTFLATNDGLYAYDGARLRRHYSPAVSALRDLAWDAASGRLYSAGNYGFGWWEDDQYGEMSYHPLETGEYSARFQDFWRVCISGSGTVFFQSQGRICLYNPSSEDIVTVYPNEAFRYMHQAGEEVLVQDGEKLFGLEDDGSLNWICKVPDRIMNIAECGGRKIAALERTGLMVLENGNLVPLNPASNRILADAKIMSLAVYDNSHILIGTTQGGLFTTDSNGRIVDDLGLRLDTVNATVLSLSTDLNGDIWLGMESGVAKIDMRSNTYYLEDARLGRVRGIAELDSGALLIGTNKGAFVISNGSLTPVPGTTGSVWNVSSFDGTVYIAHDQGLLALNGKGGVDPLYTGTGIMSITRCPEHPDMFICGSYNGLALFRQEGDRLHFLTFVDNYSGFCRHILMESEDQLWIRDSQKGFIRLTLDHTHTRVTDRKDFALIRSESDVVYSIRLQDKLFLCCNRETYSIDAASKDLVRSPEGDRLLEEFVRVYGVPAGDRNASGPLLLSDGCYATGMLGEIRISYPCKDIRESLSVSQIEALGAGKRSDIALQYSRTDIPFDMNTVLVYLAGNLTGDEVEYRTIPGSAKWKRIPFKRPVQISSLPFGRCDIEFRIPGSPEKNCGVKLNVLRPWFLGNWAIAAYILILIAIVWGLSRYYKKQAFKEQERIQLKADLKSKSKELANINFNNAKRNRELKEIRSRLTDTKIISLIDGYLADESGWEKSEEYFNVIYDGLLEKLKSIYPGISKTDMKICVYTKLNLSTKEIADIMNVSVRSVEMARYRLRKRLGLPPGQDIAQMLKDLSD